MQFAAERCLPNAVPLLNKGWANVGGKCSSFRHARS
jgi:hypothetical protein